jgi:hypothetical protein
MIAALAIGLFGFGIASRTNSLAWLSTRAAEVVRGVLFFCALADLPASLLALLSHGQNLEQARWYWITNFGT